MDDYEIPFNKPYVAGKELYYIAKAVTLGNISGDGHFTRECCRLMEERYDIATVLLTPSCTAALEMAVTLFDIGPGDEVIMPSFTFVSVANAVARVGGRPVFVDIRADTLDLDETSFEAAITERTRAICPVHYAGVACEMDSIMEVAARHGVQVFEDAAQGVHARYKGRSLGSIAPLGAYSFHATKNYTCGEGGALCINTPEFVERAEIIREKGTDRSQFLRGQVDKYRWVDVGSSYVPSEITSAFLYGQLEMLDAIAQRRREIYEFYEQALTPLAREGAIRLPSLPEGCETNYHMFHIVLEDAKTRDELMEHLRQHRISSTFHYLPLHTSPMGRTLGYEKGSLPVTEDLSERLLRLPFFFEISRRDQERVVGRITEFLGG